MQIGLHSGEMDLASSFFKICTKGNRYLLTHFKLQHTHRSNLLLRLFVTTVCITEV